MQSAVDGVAANLTQTGGQVILAPGVRSVRRGRLWVATLSSAVGAALVLVRPRRVQVEGPSMEPTLREGDRLLVVRTRRVRPGDVVALRAPGDGGRVLVKRVQARLVDAVVVLGDNPEASTDSRDFGPVPSRSVLGRVVRRYYPPERAGPVR